MQDFINKLKGFIEENGKPIGYALLIMLLVAQYFGITLPAVPELPPELVQAFDGGTRGAATLNVNTVGTHTGPVAGATTLGGTTFTATGTVQGEQLTSTDDALVTDDLTVGGNVAITGTLSAEDLTSTDDALVTDDLTVGGTVAVTETVSAEQLTSTDDITATDLVSAARLSVPIGTENIGVPTVIATSLIYSVTTGTVATITDGEVWLVHSVFIVVTTNFDCTGDDCTLEIGDGNDTDGFIVAADANLQAAFTEATGYAAGYYGIEAGSGGAYTLDDGGPFVYAPSGADETIDFAMGGTSLVAGEATVYVVYTRIL